ncbi:hypothetical protein PGB90_009640 [Kerria lacca]
MRVNGALLGQCINKNVSIIGTIQLIHPSNKAFNIMTSDNFNVVVNLKTPVSNNVAGLVEVHGICEGPSSIACDYYIVFPYNLANTYNADLDNEAIKIAFRVPNNPWQ